MPALKRRLSIVFAGISGLVGLIGLLVALCALHPPDPLSVSVEASKKGGTQRYAFHLSVLLTNSTSTEMREVAVMIEPKATEQKLLFEGAIGKPQIETDQVISKTEAMGQLRVAIDKLKIGQNISLQTSARLLPGGSLKIEAYNRPTLDGSFECQPSSIGDAVECPIQFPGTRLGVCNFLYRITKPIMGG